MKSYQSPSELYAKLLADGLKAVEGGAVIATPNFELTMTNGWEKLLFTRFIDNKIIDGYYSNNFEKFHPIDIDSDMERAKGVVKLLAFDTDWLRKERVRKSEYGDRLPVLYFSDGDITIKYSIKKTRDAKKLAIVFQPKWAKVEYIYPNLGVCTEDLFDNTMQFASYQFVKLSDEYPEYDFLYIQDDFNIAGGWYMTNFGNLIYENIVNFVELYGEKYEEVVALGASKGAYSAYHIGKKAPSVKRVGIAAAILSSGKYKMIDSSVSRNLSNNYSNKELLEEVEKIEEEVGEIDLLVASSSLKDYQYTQILKMLGNYSVTEFIDVTDADDHGDVIRKSYKEVFDKVLV